MRFPARLLPLSAVLFASTFMFGQTRAATNGVSSMTDPSGSAFADDLVTAKRSGPSQAPGEKSARVASLSSRYRLLPNIA